MVEMTVYIASPHIKYITYCNTTLLVRTHAHEMRASYYICQLYTASILAGSYYIRR